MLINSKEAYAKFESDMSYWPGAFDYEHDDTKRHFEMLTTALPILQKIDIQSTLTIGDNRGRDVYFLKKHLNVHSTASDLDISKLLPAVNDGFIDACKVVDVESIDLPDNAVDVVFVKESFHHWPRPMLGFYEALRVAKCGICLIEPFDALVSGKINSYIQQGDYSDRYEEVGNYVYQLSVRQILKASFSLYLNRVFVKGFNDLYRSDFKYEDWLEQKKILDEAGEANQRQFNLMTVFVEKQNMCCGLEIPPCFKVYQRPLNKYLES